MAKNQPVVTVKTKTVFCRLVFGREKFSGYEKYWKCFVVRGVSEGNLFWFLELRGLCLSGELLWLDDLLHAQFGNILCGALLPSVMRRES